MDPPKDPAIPTDPVIPAPGTSGAQPHGYAGDYELEARLAAAAVDVVYRFPGPVT